MAGTEREVDYGLAKDAAFAPDGQTVLVSYANGALRVLDAASMAERRALAAPRHTASRVVFHPDGQRALSASYDGTVYVWDVQRGDVLLAFATGIEAIRSMQVLPDGSALVVLGERGNRVRFFGVEDGRERSATTSHHGAVTNVAFAGKDEFCASVASYDTAYIWNLESGRSVASIPSTRQRLSGRIAAVGQSLAWSHDFTTLAIATPPLEAVECSVTLYDVMSGAERCYIGGVDARRGMRFTPEGFLVLADKHGTSLRRYDTSGNLLSALENLWLAGRFVMSADGRFAIAMNYYGSAPERTAGVHDLARGQQVATITGFSSQEELCALLPNPAAPLGLGLLTADSKGFYLWDLGEGRRTFSWLSLGDETRNHAVAVAMNGAWAAYMNVSGLIWVIALDPGARKRPPLKLYAPAAGLGGAFSPDGQRFVTGHSDGSLLVWALDQLENQR